MRKFQLNYPSIPVLSVGFTRAHTFIAKGIQLFRGGLKDKAFPNHAFLVIEYNGQKFAAEETFDGLRMTSMEQYAYEDDRIVCMYYWHGWDDPVKKAAALDRITYILREQGNKDTKLGKYQILGILSFVPVLKKIVKVDASGKEAEWCSEDCAAIHKNQGKCSWIGDVHMAPDQLMNKMQVAEKTYVNECNCVLNYYK
jgi:hypothetical protein